MRTQSRLSLENIPNDMVEIYERKESEAHTGAAGRADSRADTIQTWSRAIDMHPTRNACCMIVDPLNIKNSAKDLLLL